MSNQAKIEDKMINIGLLIKLEILIEWKNILMVGGNVGGDWLAVELNDHTALKLHSHFHTQNLKRKCVQLTITIRHLKLTYAILR